jgi:hypothetical protein
LIPHERLSLLVSPPDESFFSAKDPNPPQCLWRRTAAVLDESYRPDDFACMFRANFVFDLCADTPAACYGENQGRDNTALD